MKTLYNYLKSRREKNQYAWIREAALADKARERLEKKYPCVQDTPEVKQYDKIMAAVNERVQYDKIMAAMNERVEAAVNHLKQWTSAELARMDDKYGHRENDDMQKFDEQLGDLK